MLRVAPRFSILACIAMDHHYGRHGPRAWLHWRQRRYSSSRLPMPVQSEVTAIYVSVPTNVERIIFIFMSDPTSSESGQEVQFFNPSYTSLPPRNTDSIPKLSSGDAVVAEKAQCRAIDDAAEVRKLDRSGNFVVVNWVRVDGRAVDIAQEEVKAYRATLSSLAPEEYKRLQLVCQNAYLAYLESELKGETENVISLRDSHEVQLRAIAIQDRDSEPKRSDDHMHDLAVVRSP